MARTTARTRSRPNSVRFGNALRQSRDDTLICWRFSPGAMARMQALPRDLRPAWDWLSDCQRARLFAATRSWPAWHPTISASGKAVLFHGWLDNCVVLAAELGLTGDDPAAVYGAAVERWGDEADNHAEGHYCAISHDPAQNCARLSRSALRAPPLHYFHTVDSIGAASVPRCLEAMGLERRLNRRKLVDALYFNPTEEEGFLEGSWRVGLGQIVHLRPGGFQTCRYYDPLKLKLGWRRGDSQALTEEAGSLIEQACAVAAAA